MSLLATIYNTPSTQTQKLKHVEVFYKIPATEIYLGLNHMFLMRPWPNKLVLYLEILIANSRPAKYGYFCTS